MPTPRPLPLFFACFILSLMFVSGFVKPAIAKTEITPLSTEDKETVRRVEQYMNELGSMKSRFLQASSSGNYAEGTFYLSRPGKMRIEYDPPVKFLIVADGTWLIYHDKEIDQVTHIPLGMSPADLILEKNISFSSGDIQVSKLERGPGIVAVTIIRDEGDDGHLTLIFKDKPLELKKWIVHDSQGVNTSVSLLSTRRDIRLDPKLFHVKMRPAKFKEPLK